MRITRTDSYGRPACHEKESSSGDKLLQPIKTVRIGMPSVFRRMRALPVQAAGEELLRNLDAGKTAPTLLP